MRLEHFHAHNIGPFKDVVLDLANLPGPLVAVVGPNGVGKSTLLGLMTGGTRYRKLDPHGKLAGLAKARDSFIETTFTEGQRWTVRHTVDSLNGNGESLVLDADGKPAFGDVKVSSFDVWSKANLAPPSVLYASSVSVQQSTGFLGMGRADSMSVLLRVIGAEHLEILAERARKAGTAAVKELDTLLARLADVVADAVDAAAAAATAMAAQSDMDLHDPKVMAAREALRRSELLAVDSQAAQEVRARRVAAVSRVAAARAEVADVAERQGNNRDLVADAANIRAAVARDGKLIGEIDELQDRHRAQKTDAAALESEHAVMQGKWDRAVAAERAARDAQRAARARLEDEVIIAAATGAAATQREWVAEHELAISGAAPALERLQRMRLSHKDDRIDGMRKGLTEIADDHNKTGMDAAQCANGYLADDDAHVEALEDLPADIVAAVQELDEHRKALALAQSMLTSAEKLAARSGEMEAARADLAKAEDDEVDAATTIKPLNVVMAEKASNRNAKTTEARATGDRVDALRSEQANLLPLLKRARHLDAAETRLEELAKTHAALSATLATHEAELAELPEAPEDGEAPDVERYRAELKQVEMAGKIFQQVVASCAATVERAEKDAARIEKMRGEVAAVEVELSDWRKLAADLGRDGIQNSMIDSAVPVLDTHINSLLHECHGSQWSVSIKTDKLVDKGKSTREALEIRVVDSVTGRDDLASHFSPGEQAILGEAMALALTVLGCECAGTDEIDLVRDETGAPLDVMNGEAYIRMLRKAAEIVDAKHVFYISHSPELQAAADSRIVISMDGTVEVQS